MILRQPLQSIFITQKFGADFQWSNPKNGKVEWFYKDTFGLAGHPGIDYRCVVGTPVYASHDGVCLYSGFDETSGNMIQIWNEQEGYKTLYGHNSFNKAKQGDIVKVGQLIALSGNTGASNGQHLHFGFKHTKEGGNSLDLNDGYNGAVDPAPYIKQDYLGNNLKDMVFKKIKGDKNVYLVNDVMGTKIMIVDLPTLNALDGVIEEVSELAGYIDKGTLIWCERIID